MNHTEVMEFFTNGTSFNKDLLMISMSIEHERFCFSEFGFDQNETVALMGAHTLGQVIRSYVAWFWTISVCQVKGKHQLQWLQDNWLQEAGKGLWTKRGANDFNNQYYKVLYMSFIVSLRLWFPATTTSTNLSLVGVIIILSPGFGRSECILGKRSWSNFQIFI